MEIKSHDISSDPPYIRHYFYPSWSIQTPHHVIAHEIDEDSQSKPQLEPPGYDHEPRLLHLKDVSKLITLIETHHIMSFRHLFFAGPFLLFFLGKNIYLFLEAKLENVGKIYFPRCEGTFSVRKTPKVCCSPFPMQS